MPAIEFCPSSSQINASSRHSSSGHTRIDGKQMEQAAKKPATDPLLINFDFFLILFISSEMPEEDAAGVRVVRN